MGFGFPKGFSRRFGGRPLYGAPSQTAPKHDIKIILLRALQSSYLETRKGATLGDKTEKMAALPETACHHPLAICFEAPVSSSLHMRFPHPKRPRQPFPSQVEWCDWAICILPTWKRRCAFPSKDCAEVSQATANDFLRSVSNCLEERPFWLVLKWCLALREGSKMICCDWIMQNCIILKNGERSKR